MKSTSMRAIVPVLALSALTLVGTAIAHSGEAVEGKAVAIQPAHSPMQGSQTRAVAKARSPEVILVAFHADWCASCQALGPKMMTEVFPSVKSEPYLLVNLDMTDRDSNQAEFMLATLGLESLWEQHGRKTGFVVMVDASTKKVLNTFTLENESAEIVQSVKAACHN